MSTDWVAWRSVISLVRWHYAVAERRLAGLSAVDPERMAASGTETDAWAMHEFHARFAGSTRALAATHHAWILRAAYVLRWSDRRIATARSSSVYSVARDRIAALRAVEQRAQEMGLIPVEEK
jgi:hypothetical protein